MIKSANTKKIEDELIALGDNRKIVVRPIEELRAQMQNDSIGALIEKRNEILIYLDFSFPDYSQESAYVHELLHVKCTLEGYPNIILNKKYKKILRTRNNWELAEGLRDDLWNAIQHPYVFTREIYDYNLKNVDVFNVTVGQKIRRFEKRKNDKRAQNAFQKRFLAQQDILMGLEYFYYPEKHQKKIFEIYKDLNIDSYNSCVELHKKLDFSTKEATFKSGNIILDYLKEYSRKNRIERINTFWNLLKVTYEKPHLLFY